MGNGSGSQKLWVKEELKSIEKRDRKHKRRKEVKIAKGGKGSKWKVEVGVKRKLWVEKELENKIKKKETVRKQLERNKETK